MIRLSNLIAALRCQLPLRRAFRNFFITGNAWGIFSIHSHISQSTGKPKVVYPTLESAQRAAGKMQRKHQKSFRAYKCVFCNGYHIGKIRVVRKSDREER